MHNIILMGKGNLVLKLNFIVWYVNTNKDEGYH